MQWTWQQCANKRVRHAQEGTRPRSMPVCAGSPRTRCSSSSHGLPPFTEPSHSLSVGRSNRTMKSWTLIFLMAPLG